MSFFVGTVKSFQRGYGFIIPETRGDDIFFHTSDGRRIIAGKTQPEFTAIGVNRQPQWGDVVVYSKTEGPKGWKASPWGFKDEFDKAKQEVDRRPKPTLYRVLSQKVFQGEEKPWEVIWGDETGKTVIELCNEYPRHRTWDDLRTFDHNDGFKTRYEIQYNDNGNWKPVEEDPRPILR